MEATHVTSAIVK